MDSMGEVVYQLLNCTVVYTVSSAWIRSLPLTLRALRQHVSLLLWAGGDTIRLAFNTLHHPHGA